MSKKVSLAFLICCAWLAFTMAFASPPPTRAQTASPPRAPLLDADAPNRIAGQYIVVFKATTSRRQANQTTASIAATFRRHRVV